MFDEDPHLQGARARVGTVLRGKWQIDRLLGVGGFASVFAASNRTKKRVAIKMLHLELSQIPEVRARFLREALAANTVDHPGAVSVFDEDVAEDGSAFLVMDFCQGETFEARRERLGGVLGAGEVLSLVDQVLDVVIAAHDKGVLHRDLKPENMFLTDEGRVKVLDFGLARLKESAFDEGPSQPITRSGLMMGTLAFMPPEQARGHWTEVDARTDLWAVGASMFTLLSGKLVHEGDGSAILVAAITNPARSLASVVPGAAQTLVALVDKALAFDKAERWQDARAMQSALRQTYQALMGSPATPSIGDDPTVDAQQEAPSVRSPEAEPPSLRHDGPRGTVRMSRPADPEEEDDPQAATALWRPAPKGKPETLGAPDVARLKATLPFVRAPAFKPPARRRPIGLIALIAGAVVTLLGIAVWALRR